MPTAGKRGQLLGVLALCVVAAVGPVATLAVVHYRSPIPFVAALVMLAFAVAWLVRIAWSWRHPPRRASGPDFVLVVVPLVTGMIALALLSELARSAGIRGSALPRVLRADPFAADYAYLGAIAAVVAMMAAAVVLLVLLMRSLPRVRALSKRAGATSGEAVDTVEEMFAVPAEARQTVAVTSASDAFWRRLMGRSAWVLFAICAALSVPGLWLVAADYEGNLGLVGGVILWIGVPVTAWAVLQSVWRRDKQLGVLMSSICRSIAVPVVTALPIGLLQLLVVHLPVFADRVRSFQRPEEMYEGHYWFPLENQDLFTLFALDVTLGGAVFAGVAGLVVAVFLVLPITAFRDPDQFIKEQGLSASREHRSRNVVVVRLLALGLPLAFVVPALLVDSDPNDLRRWIGIALAVVGVAAMYFIWRIQRVDVAGRATSGQPMGVLNPDDRKRLSDIDTPSDR